MSVLGSDEDGHPVEAAIEQVLAEVAGCVRQVSSESLAQAGDLIEAAPRIFVAGSGRSGLCMRAFGMRLMHLGMTVYIVGETTTPRIKSQDLLILGTGSAQSALLLKIAEMAQEQGARQLLLTAEPVSPLSELADHTVVIPAPSLKPFLAERDFVSMQPMGSLFEQSLLIVCDSLIVALMDQIGVGLGKMRKYHANLE